MHVDPGVGAIPAEPQRLGARHLHQRLAAGDHRIGAGEAEAGQLADGAAAPVASDQPARAHGLAGGLAGEPDRDAFVIRLEARQLSAAPHVGAAVGGPLPEDQLDCLLPDAHHGHGRARVAERRILEVDAVGADHDASEVADHPRCLPRRCLPRRRVSRRRRGVGLPGAHECPHALQGQALLIFERGQHAPPVERLGGGHVDRASLDRRVDLRQPLDHEHAHPGEPQLAGQHQAHRAAPRYHDVVVHQLSRP